MLVRFPILDIAYNLVNVLTMALSIIDLKGDVGNSFQSCLIFKVCAELPRIALKKNECILLFIFWDSGEEYAHMLAIFRSMDRGDSYKGIGVSFRLDEAGCKFLYDRGKPCSVV